MKTYFIIITFFLGLNLFAQEPSHEWVKTMGNNGGDVGKSVVTDNQGNVYSTGYFSNTVDFDPGPGTMNLTSEGGNDIYVQKLDSDGNFVWALSFGSTGTDQGLCIALDGFGNVIIAGIFQGIIDFNPGGISYNLSTNGIGVTDYFILKLSNSGVLLWAMTNGNTGNGRVEAIAVDSVGNVYVTGSFQGVVDFDPTNDVYDVLAVGTRDLFVQLLNPSGNLVWVSTWGG